MAPPAYGSTEYGSTCYGCTYYGSTVHEAHYYYYYYYGCTVHEAQRVEALRRDAPQPGEGEVGLAARLAVVA
eukprot:scaffold50213_cov57-Phaeocystis_antarctica.AAC.4